MKFSLLTMGLFAAAFTVLLRPQPLVSGFLPQITSAVGRTSAATSLLYATNKGSTENTSFSSFFGDMASSILGKTMERVPGIDEKMKLVEPSWEDIGKQLVASQTEMERRFRSNLAYGYGIGSPLHKVRLYDESNKEEDIRITFYRDSASWCPYCQKVWMTLEEKKIPYRVEKVNMRCYGDKPASFSRLQPSGQIPVAVIDGKVFGQSNDILSHLESEAFSEYKSLQPADSDRTKQLLQLERKIFSAWMYWLTGGGQQSKARFLETLNEVESALARSGPFFTGKDVSLVDFQYAPFLERMAASLIYYKGFQLRVPPGMPTDYVAINKWFDAMETLPSYQLTRSDYYTHCWDLPPQLGGCVSETGGEKFSRAINGECTLDGTMGSWEIPLQPHNGGIEPDGDMDEATARREAVERVSANYEALVRFAARGAGRKGFPVSAPLADPNTVPNDAMVDSVSAILRVVCAALLEGSPKKFSAEMEAIGFELMNIGGNEFASSVVDCLAYMRDRIGVPRDMTYPAARQLRAYLNWSIGNILKIQRA